jgi:putative sigma-54 modulation protein
MQIRVTCRHMDVTDSLRDHAITRVEHDLHSFDRVEDVHVIMDVQKIHHIAEVVVKGKGHIHLESKEESEDMYNSIDRAVEKMAKQLRKNRDKIQDHRHASTAEAEQMLRDEV